MRTRCQNARIRKSPTLVVFMKSPMRSRRKSITQPSVYSTRSSTVLAFPKTTTLLVFALVWRSNELVPPDDSPSLQRAHRQRLPLPLRARVPVSIEAPWQRSAPLADPRAIYTARRKIIGYVRIKIVKIARQGCDFTHSPLSAASVVSITRSRPTLLLLEHSILISNFLGSNNGKGEFF